ncbi:MAG: ABC transporter substrate-binding protein [Gaiellales bacterium]|nr:MAG: ABC transporter substrate-binding protein [Gaiellales bacterium]
MESKVLPKIPFEREEDLHNLELLGSADFILFMAGNQFMVMPELIAAFQEECPEAGNIFYETLPPGLELKQILAGKAVFQEQVIEVRPDVYTSVSEMSMRQLQEAGMIEPGGYSVYLHNRIVLMVPEGNPAGITCVADLGREEVRISQPNPENEDLGCHVCNMYRHAGGYDLVDAIMEDKVDDGTTLLTEVHHRETPEGIISGQVDVGPVWATEYAHARREGLPVEVVEPGEELDQRDRVGYYICRLTDAPNPENGDRFVEFITGPRAQAIYASYGFVPCG